jgi:hypothetical protein
MIGIKRAGTALLALVMAGGAGASLMAQIPGMPLFTNPRYATGLRIHGDIGQPTDQGTNLGELTVLQGGVTFALGPVGLGANVGSLKRTVDAAAICNTSTGAGCDPNSNFTASVLAQIRVAGGGRSNLSLSVFGGGSMDVNAREIGNLPAGLPQVVQDSLNALYAGPKVLTIPLGVAVGLRIPLGLASLNLWGAPRMNLTRFTDCPGTCPDGDSNFRWAVGADLPIFRVLSIRAAYDSGKIGDETVSVWGVGASIGIGGMR